MQVKDLIVEGDLFVGGQLIDNSGTEYTSRDEFAQLWAQFEEYTKGTITVFTGPTAPSASTGKNGDVYLVI